MDYKIVNGIIVTAADIYRADLGINNGKIVQIADKIKEPAADVLDAKGQYVIPGGIDVHTHLDMPFGGTIVSDDFETGTIASACGGTTCVVDFDLQQQGESIYEALERKKGIAGYLDVPNSMKCPYHPLGFIGPT